MREIWPASLADGIFSVAAVMFLFGVAATMRERRFAAQRDRRRIAARRKMGDSAGADESLVAAHIANQWKAGRRIPIRDA